MELCKRADARSESNSKNISRRCGIPLGPYKISQDMAQDVSQPMEKNKRVLKAEPRCCLKLVDVVFCGFVSPTCDNVP